MEEAISTSVLCGLEAKEVRVEVSLKEGKSEQGFRIVGLADSALKESRERIQAALRSLGIKLPASVLVNLAPAELKKEGTSLELGIAVALLVALRLVPRQRAEKAHYIGELSLDGSIRPCRGIISHLLCASEQKKQLLFTNAETELPGCINTLTSLLSVPTLAKLAGTLRSDTWPQCLDEWIVSSSEGQTDQTVTADVHPFSGVFGQRRAKRALVVAATGGHNLLFIGPPGAGKTLLAERFTDLLPPLAGVELVESLKIYSATGLPTGRLLQGNRPFRQPHYGSSEVALCGGGTVPQPGEVTLSHNGVLFLDEFPEFRRGVLESLRTPLESGKIYISRAKARVCFPAKFLLVAAMNPCPCGYYGFSGKPCNCSQSSIEKYLSKLSGPLLDRIDMQLGIESLPLENMRKEQASENEEFADVRERISTLRSMQLQRQGKLNGALTMAELFEHSGVSESTFREAESLSRKFFFSTRTSLRLLRLARTLADLDDSETVEKSHLVEAFSFRLLDKWKGEFRRFY